MSQAIVLASSVKHIVPVAVYVVTDGESEFGKTRNFTAACEFMRGIVGMGNFKVRVDSTREYRFE